MSQNNSTSCEKLRYQIHFISPIEIIMSELSCENIMSDRFYSFADQI